MGHLLPSSESIITRIQHLVFLKCQKKKINACAYLIIWQATGREKAKKIIPPPHFVLRPEGNMNMVIYKKRNL